MNALRMFRQVQGKPHAVTAFKLALLKRFGMDHIRIRRTVQPLPYMNGHEIVIRGDAFERIIGASRSEIP